MVREIGFWETSPGVQRSVNVGLNAPTPAYGYPTPLSETMRRVCDVNISYMLFFVEIVIKIMKPPSPGLPLLALPG